MKYINNKQELTSFFNEEYYHSINYVDYELRKEKYFRTAEELVTLFDISEKDVILDYGCAIGLLLEGYRELNIHNVYGFDISEWAIDQAKKKGINVSSNLESLKNLSYKLTTVLDVFEHMFDEDVETVLNTINTDLLAVRIPTKIPGEVDFHLEVSRKDKSHVNCKTKEDWIKKISEHNFEYVSDILTNTVYDSKGVFCGYFKRIV